MYVVTFFLKETIKIVQRQRISKCRIFKNVVSWFLLLLFLNFLLLFAVEVMAEGIEFYILYQSVCSTSS